MIKADKTMVENIFEPSFGNRPDAIVGRDEELALIDKGLSSRQGSRNRAMFVVGQRGMGKTALLLEAESRARDAGFVTARVNANESMLESIIERLQMNGSEYVKQDKRKLAGFEAGALGFSFGLTFADEVQSHYGFQTKLSLLCDRLAECEKKVLILVDEVRSSSPQMRELSGVYQQLVGDGKEIAICMAGLPAAISSVLNDDVLTFLNRATKIRLASLPLKSIRSYFGYVFAAMGRSFDNGVLEAAVEATQGFPYMLQLLGYYLVEESSVGGLVTKPQFDRALANAKDDLRDNVFAPTLSALSPKDIEFLQALARLGGRASVSQLQSELKASHGHLQVYRKRLIDSDVVVSPSRGMLEFALPYLADYLCSIGNDA